MCGSLLCDLFTYWWSGSYAFQVGIYVAPARKLPIICAIVVHIPCARDVSKMLITNAYEETKDSVEHVCEL